MSKNAGPPTWRWERHYKLLKTALYIGGLTLFFVLSSIRSIHNGLILLAVLMTFNTASMLLLLLLGCRRDKEMEKRIASPGPKDIAFFIEELKESQAGRTKYDSVQSQHSLMKQSRIKWALARALVATQINDIALIRRTHRHFLNKALLNSTTTPDLVRAILTAWERAGDREAIPFVAKLAEGEAIAATNSYVREQAQECLLVLHERAAQKQNTGTLLRASSLAHSPDELLRAADSTRSNPEADAQLVRPSLGQEETSAW